MEIQRGDGRIMLQFSYEISRRTETEMGGAANTTDAPKLDTVVWRGRGQHEIFIIYSVSDSCTNNGAITFTDRTKIHS